MSDPVSSSDESDGSMETILASIRRIIREDEEAVAAPAPVATVATAAEDDDDVLVLDQSMMVQPTDEEAAMTINANHAPDADAVSAAELAAALFDGPPSAPSVLPPAIELPAPVVIAPAPPHVAAAPAPVPVPEAMLPRPTHALMSAPDETLLAPQARLVASQSLAALHDAMKPRPDGLRLLRNGGSTIEDMVREELRLQLKDWLDANLPQLVERLVRQEIEQLVRPG